MNLNRQCITRQLISRALLGTLIISNISGQQLAAPHGNHVEENVTVLGKRFHLAPVPVINGSFDAHGSGSNLQDVNTGAATGKFGQAYSDSISDPAKPIDPGAGTVVGSW